MKVKVLLPVVAVVLALGAGVGWALWPEEAPEPPAAPGDTGMTADQTEELMRTIGYVQ